MQRTRTRLLMLTAGVLCLHAVSAQRSTPGTNPASARPHHGVAKGSDRTALNIYCQPTYTTGPTDGDFIDGVQFGDIQNTSSGGTGVDAYTDFSYDGAPYITRVNTGQFYDLTITSGSYVPDLDFEGFSAWIDFDQNGNFDTEELVGHIETTTPFESQTISVFIPNEAIEGYTGLRITNAYDLDVIEPCGGYVYGETEDYTVLIENVNNCIPLYTRGTTFGDYISSVSVNDQELASFGQSVHAYSDLSFTGAQLHRGQVVVDTVVSGDYGGDYFGVWVDWNADGDFDDDGEQVGYAFNEFANSPLAFVFTVPADAAFGYTIMRVRCIYDEPEATACSDAEYGETQDFTVSITGGAFPCLPIVGSGTQFGDGFTELTVEGNTYFGAVSWPYHTLVGDPVHYESGSAQTWQITSGTYFPERYQAHMDMNDDGDMDDPGEDLGWVESTTAEEALSLNFTIPANCPPGQHVLRVHAYDPGENTLVDGCGDTFYGEIIDVPVAVQAPDGVCIPYLSYWTIYTDFLDGVQLGSISNTGSGAELGAPYTDYTAQSTTLSTNTTYTLTVTSGIYDTDDFYAWIDYNADGDWDDADEFLGSVAIEGSYTDGDIEFTVPATSIGTKRMRVRCTDDALLSACDDSFYGETEDYTVEITTTTGIAANATGTNLVIAHADAGFAELRTAPQWNGANYRVLDALGREVSTGRVAGTITNLPMAGASQGAYTVSLRSADATGTVRFVWEQH